MNQYSVEELCHYGILGMKWGRRRASSSRTSSKKSRYNMSQDAKEANSLKKKKVRELSNAELRKLNERQNLERTHKTLNPSAISRGAKIVGITAASLGTIVALKTNGKQVIDMGKSAVDVVLKRG